MKIWENKITHSVGACINANNVSISIPTSFCHLCKIIATDTSDTSVYDSSLKSGAVLVSVEGDTLEENIN